MLGESENQFSLTRAALSTRGVQKQFPINFHFELSGPTGSNFVLQASTDLSAWTPVATNRMPAAGFLLITDPFATNYNWRFYRALSE